MMGTITPTMGGRRATSTRAVRGNGFTLIELMVVVTIIGILAAIGIPKLGKFIKTAETAEAVDFASKISRGVSGYVSQHTSMTNTILQGSTSIGTYNLSCPTGSTLCTTSNKISVAIPTIEQPASMLWLFTVAAKLNDSTGSVETCVMAEKLTDVSTKDTNSGPVYFSSITATSALWEGNVLRTQYLDKTASFIKGGACAAATPTADTSDQS